MNHIQSLYQGKLRMALPMNCHWLTQFIIILLYLLMAIPYCIARELLSRTIDNQTSTIPFSAWPVFQMKDWLRQGYVGGADNNDFGNKPGRKFSFFYDMPELMETDPGELFIHQFEDIEQRIYPGMSGQEYREAEARQTQLGQAIQKYRWQQFFAEALEIACEQLRISRAQINDYVEQKRRRESTVARYFTGTSRGIVEAPVRKSYAGSGVSVDNLPGPIEKDNLLFKTRKDERWYSYWPVNQ